MITQRDLIVPTGLAQKKLSEAVRGKTIPTHTPLKLFVFAQEIGVAFTMSPTENEKLYNPEEILGNLDELRLHYVHQLRILMGDRTQAEWGLPFDLDPVRKSTY